MFGKKKKNAIAYGIIGLGRFGEALATELARSGAELLVMDREEERVREMRELTENALVVNTLDKKTLTETGIQNCDIAVVCIGEQLVTVFGSKNRILSASVTAWSTNTAAFTYHSLNEICREFSYFKKC